MGGKSKLMDPEILKVLYEESKVFMQETGHNVEEIKKEIAILNDPSLQSGFSTEQSQATRDAIKALFQSVDLLKETLQQTNNFIDNKLVGSKDIMHDKGHSRAQESRRRDVFVNLVLRK
ncbi:hypothetical protein [Cytobacillus sp. IB215316]|uniref:hypothetical protein n=1 Tax=Cytobacillus sp. IB215316 TaxID=3097354 RepID=UPI002A13C109|nr:hypothetical protein [Cytobacillus sp. IB215316]MDX8360777.1 hypothetical protein [Cytobacillus sp. IB215316]